MPVTLYSEDEVQVYTRVLARAYEMIRDDPATDIARGNLLKEIEKIMGWTVPPPTKGGK